MEEFTSGFTDTQAAVTALIGFTPDLSYCLALTKTSFHAPAPMKFTGLSGGDDFSYPTSGILARNLPARGCKTSTFWSHYMTALSSILSSLDVFAKSTSLSDTFDGGAVPLIIALMTITNVLSTLALSHVDAIIDAVAADPKNAVDVQETCQYKDLPLVKSPQDMWVRIIGGWKFEWKANGWFLFQHGLLRQISVLVTRLQYDFRWRHDQMASAKDVKFFQPDDKIEQSLGAQFGANAVQCLIRNTYEDCHALLVEGIDGSSHSRSISPMLVSEEEGARRTGRTAKSDDMATLATTGISKLVLSYFGIGGSEKKVKFAHEGCSLCIADGTTQPCDGCMNEFCAKGECPKHFELRKERGGNSNDKLEVWLCPVCRASSEMISSVEVGDLGDVQELLQRGADPFYGDLRKNAEMTSPMHTAALTNNYEALSIMLFGAYFIVECQIELMEGIDGNIFPERTWPRNQNKETPFEAAYQANIRGARHCTETMMLLASRGCGSWSTAINAQAKRIELDNLIANANGKRKRSGGGMPEGGDQEFPRGDISMGAEPIPVPWVNDTDDGVTMTGEWTYVMRTLETRRTAIKWYKSYGGWRSGNLLKPWKRGQIINGTKVATASVAPSCDRTEKSKCLMLQNNQNNGKIHHMDCNYMCPCNDHDARNLNAKTGAYESPSCTNQVLHEGVRYPLEVFRRPGVGWAVRTQKGVTIPAGEIVSTYSGLYQRECDSRDLEEQYENENKMSFIMNLKGESRDARPDDIAIDGTDFKSVTAFFNHQCEAPNIKICDGLRNHLDTNFIYRYFLTTMEVPPLTELLFNYGLKKGIECRCKECSEGAGKKITHCLCDPCKLRVKCKKLNM